MKKSFSNNRKPLSSRGLHIETLEPRVMLAGDTYLFNFQIDEATPPSRYLTDTGQVFANRGNGFSYGWSSDHIDQARERSIEADQRLDTLIHIEAGQQWEFALANGNYEVTVAVGDPGNNDGVHTINIEGVNLLNAVPDGVGPQIATQVITVSDGRLTLDQGAAADKSTRINYLHIVGVPSVANQGPVNPTITEPAVDGQEANPADVHMEAVGYSDMENDAHKSSDWEIWTVGVGAEPVWQTLGIQGVERLHTHLGDGIYLNSQAGQIALTGDTDYELRVRFRDDTGAVSGYASRLFHAESASTDFPLEIEDIAILPQPTWTDPFGLPIELPIGVGILSTSDATIPIDLDVSTGSESPAGEPVQNLLDDDSTTKYLNFGKTNTGFIVTLSAAEAVRSFRLTTANDAEDRDPDSWILYGTNDTITTVPHGNGRDEGWTQIAAGGLSLPAARETTSGATTFINTTNYLSYKLIFPTVKDVGAANSMQIADAGFYTSTNGFGTNLLSAATDIVPIRDADGVSESGSPGNESADKIIDQNAATKYLNFGKENTGFIITPTSGASTVKSFLITTADDFAVRDPASWILYGTNEVINSTTHSQGNGENWTLIDSGSLNLPLARNTLSASIPVANTVEYDSYRMVFPTVRDPNSGDADSLQLAEIQFFGEETGTPTPPTLQIEAGATGDPFYLIEGSQLPGNTVSDFPAMAEHFDVRVVIDAGSSSLLLGQSDLTFEDSVGVSHTIFMPSINLLVGEELHLWVSSSGATYFGDALQTAPDFTSLARAATLDIPFIATQPGYVIEEVGSDYRLPVNIAFVPDPGPNPDDPLYFVTELYGSIQVVTRDGTKHEFATGLLDYNPQGPISGSGEQGLTGIAVQRDPGNPEVYQLYVGMLWDNGSAPGNSTHYPKLERIDSVAGGLAMDARTVLLNMQPETQGQSHQISNITIGPDGKIYVHNGDGFDASTAQNLDSFRGKVLRLNMDGTPADDNPFYDAGDGINSRDYVFAYGLRNPFGGAWRAADGKHYSVENGPSVDRMAQINSGVNYGWDGSNASMFNEAIYNWNPAHAPVNITFVQPETFAGSQFPIGQQDIAFVSESGPTYAAGPQANGKRIVGFEFDNNGDLVGGPTTLIEYVGTGHSSVVGIAAGPDGLYFTELYEDLGAGGATGIGARIYRVSYVNPLAGDYDIDGDVDQADYDVWSSTYGSNLLLGADGNGNGVIDAADYTVWRDNLGQSIATTTQMAQEGDSSVSVPAVSTSHDQHVASASPVASPITTPTVEKQAAFANYLPLAMSIESPRLNRSTLDVQTNVPMNSTASQTDKTLLLINTIPFDAGSLYKESAIDFAIADDDYEVQLESSDDSNLSLLENNDAVFAGYRPR